MKRILQRCTIIRKRRSTELTAVWRGKLIGGYVIKMRFELAVQHLDKNSTDMYS